MVINPYKRIWTFVQLKIVIATRAAHSRTSLNLSGLRCYRFAFFNDGDDDGWNCSLITTLAVAHFSRLNPIKCYRIHTCCWRQPGCMGRVQSGRMWIGFLRFLTQTNKLKFASDFVTNPKRITFLWSHHDRCVPCCHIGPLCLWLKWSAQITKSGLNKIDDEIRW